MCTYCTSPILLFSTYIQISSLNQSVRETAHRITYGDLGADYRGLRDLVKMKEDPKCRSNGIMA